MRPSSHVVALTLALSIATGAAAYADDLGKVDGDPDPASTVGIGDQGRLPFALRTGEIVYTSNKGALWLLDPASGHRRQLTHPAHGVDFDPRFSGDGTRIVFRSERGVKPGDPFHVGYNALFTLNRDGTHLRQVNPPGGGLFPAWSPTDDLIAFSGPSADPRVDHILVMTSDGSGTARDLGVRGECARWSPDGTRIAYCSHNGDGNWAVWTVGADGSDPHQLTHPVLRPPAGANGDYPVAWSPNGRRIVISSARDGLRAMYLLDADGGNAHRLLHSTKGVDSPSVWLRGGWIVFAHYASERARPRWYAVRPDGSHRVRLSSLDGAGDPIDWSAASYE